MLPLHHRGSRTRIAVTSAPALVLLELLSLARVLELRERLRLDLAYAFARDADLGADRLEGHGLLGREAVAELQDASLAPLERSQRGLEVALAHRRRHLLDRRLRGI